MRINFAFAGVLKCKRDRKFLKEQCPVCEFPITLRGSSILHLQRDTYTCTRPWIHPHFKQSNFTLDDGDYPSVYPKDFVAPIGILEMNITDQFNNDAWIACVVQRPTGMENLTANFGLNGKDLTALSAIISTSLVCNIDYDNIRQIWNILAMYSESPMRLEREVLLSLQPDTVYLYKQVVPTADYIFTEIEAKMKASPEWLMQSTVLLQLDRITTTFPNLTIKYLTNVQIHVDSRKDSRDQYGWAMIRKDSQTKTEHAVLAGGVIELNCQTFGDPKPIVEWILPDGSKLLAYNGRLILKSVEISDTGVYHCIATNYLDADFVVTLSVVAYPTRILEKKMRDIKVLAGKTVHLECRTDGRPVPMVSWILPNHTEVKLITEMGSRIKVLENGTLIIESVNEKDAGDFVCVARNKLGDDVQLIRVSMSMKPARIKPNVFSRKKVTYGNDLKVDCVAAGVPMPEISWGLPDVGSDEEGDYTCYAENKLGKDKMHVHISVVTAVPRIQRPILSYAKVKPGRNVRFDCKAIGEPKPNVFWMLPSKDIIAASNDRYLVHANGSLDIQNVKLVDAGEHVCMARNAAGEENKEYKLDIDGNPPIINGLNQNRTVLKDTAVKYTRKLIDCKAEGDPAPKITWIMPDNIFLTAPYYGSRINVHSNGTLEIRNVRPSDTAEFICMAQNDGGEAVMLVQMEVTDKLRRPIFNNPFNERVVTRVGRTAVLNCSADGQPMPEIIWTLPNRTRFSGTPGFKGSRYHLGTDGTFAIYNSSIEDTGKYRCAAKNKVGYIEKLVIFETNACDGPLGLALSVFLLTIYLYLSM
uniref:Ig-like domain-containing protein n=1 Tax=Sinocyclocheilus rhinocerous TaxID=307959 RepID=A0A673H4X4_9TELE